VSDLLDCVEVEAPARGGATGAVIWLHGLGADGHDFAPIVPELALPFVRFVFPHAPVRSVTINGGVRMRAWYDIEFLGRGGANMTHVRESARQIESLIGRELERGLSTTRVVLAGFSQGGAVALYTATRLAAPLLGLMVLSAYELAPADLDVAAAANRDTPLLFCHGTYDPLLPVALGREAAALHRRPGRSVSWHEFPIGHEVSYEEIRVVADWLHGLFGRG
jgi:phospholipase/carboxylesterase